MNVNQQVNNTPLNPDDDKLIRWWINVYGKALWLWGAFLLFLLLFTIMAFYFYLQAHIDLIAVLIFVPFELFFAWKLIDAVQKKRKLRTALGKGIKQVISGRLQQLAVSQGNRLKYHFNGSTIQVTAPGPYSGLTGSHCLRNAAVQLEILVLPAQSNILLAIHYSELPRPIIHTQAITADEKAALLKMGWISRGIKKYKEKKIITGIISEVISVRYKSGKYSAIKKMCWYRVGMEMVPGSSYNIDNLQPGDKASFEYLINEKGERQGFSSPSLVSPGR